MSGIHLCELLTLIKELSATTSDKKGNQRRAEATVLYMNTYGLLHEDE